MLYLGIAVQLSMIGVQALVGVQIPARLGHLSIQYGELSLMIL
jgi:hypothetical protein